MNERIVYSGEQMMASLDEALKELNAFRYDKKFRETLGESLIKKILNWEKDILSQRDAPFTIVVIGDFKRGKSTLINAILGEEVVTSDVTTETVTLNQIDYGEGLNEAVMSGNRRAILTNEELKKERLEKVIADLGEPIEALEIKRPIEMLKKVRIIDTPGTGDAMKDFGELVQGCLVKADAVIYVYNIQYPLSKSEQLFLKSAVLPRRQTKLFLVGNYGDVLSGRDDYERVRDMLKERIEGFLPGATVYMVSALDELCCRMGETPEETEIRSILREQFGSLRRELDKLVADRADSVIVSRMQRLTSAMAFDIDQNLDAMEKGLDLSDEEARKTANEAEEEHKVMSEHQNEIKQYLKESIDAMRSEAMAWMSGFMERISGECRNLGDESADDIKRYFEFYCVDLLQQAMNTCVEYHEDRLYEMLEEVSGDLSSRINDVIPEQKGYQFRINLDNRIWTKGDTIGFVAGFLPTFGFVGAVASMVADGMAGFIREKESEKKVPDLMGQISQKLLGLKSEISMAVNKQYEDLDINVEKALTAYYNDENDKRRELMEETLQSATKSIEEKKNMRSVISEARDILERVASFDRE